MLQYSHNSKIHLTLDIQNPTRSYNFGYSRLEVIIAVVNVIFIWALTAALVVEAIARFVCYKFFAVH